jgi:hypothetical protein
MVYGLYDPRGDDPVKLASYEAVYRRLATGDPVYFQPVSRWDSPWLDRLGVRWVMAGGGEAAPAAGWRLAYAGPDARVYERPTALPLLRWAPEPAATAVGTSATSPDEGLALLRREPGRWEIAWRSARPRLLVAAETWERGWQARAAGGGRLPVETAAGVLLGVRLGPGAGRLELRYRPPGLVAGAAVTCAALLALAALPVLRRLPGRQPSTATGVAGRHGAAAAAGPIARGVASPTGRLSDGEGVELGDEAGS